MVPVLVAQLQVLLFRSSHPASRAHTATARVAAVLAACFAVRLANRTLYGLVDG